MRIYIYTVSLFHIFVKFFFWAIECTLSLHMKTIPSDEKLYDSRLIKMNKQTEICEFITMLTMLMVKWLKIDGGSLCLFYFGACLYFCSTALICVRFAWKTFKWNEWYKCIERTHSRTYVVYHMPFIPLFLCFICILK